MTKQVFQEFMAKVAQDAELRREVEALKKDEKGVPVSELAALAARRGYSFSVEDVSTDSSEEELAGVAGGLLPAVNLAYKIFTKVDSFIKLDGLYKLYKCRPRGRPPPPRFGSPADVERTRPGLARWGFHDEGLILGKPTHPSDPVEASLLEKGFNAWDAFKDLLRQ